MKIYTKTGDEGNTGLFGGERISKDDIRIEAYGTVDELNAHIGVLIAALEEQIPHILPEIQSDLFTIGSQLATKDAAKLMIAGIDKKRIAALEQQIDIMDLDLPLLTSFVLPGGHATSALAHVCRTVTRRAERHVVTLSRNETIDQEITIYLNRLSDYFFVLSRYLNYKNGVNDVPWVASK